MSWGGEYSQFLEAEQQMYFIGPLALGLIFMILFALYGNFKFPVTIALGVIIEGETAHGALVGQSVTEALMRVMLNTSVPVVHEVLLLQSEEQARARCLADELNRGTEAARVAMHMAQVMGQFPRR